LLRWGLTDIQKQEWHQETPAVQKMYEHISKVNIILGILFRDQVN